VRGEKPEPLRFGLCFAVKLRQHLAPGFSRLQPGVGGENTIQ
jgi:hypothetical protein